MNPSVWLHMFINVAGNLSVKLGSYARRYESEFWKITVIALL